MAPKRQQKKQQPKKIYDYSGLEKGMRVQAESDGTYYAAEVVQVSDSKNRAKAPVKVSYNGYEGYDEWVGGDRLRSKALKATEPEKKDRSDSSERPARGPSVVDRCRVFQNITDTVGQTPIVKVSDRIVPEGVNLYLKLEYFNPLGSVKDRLAKAIIEDGEKTGELKPGGTVVEATSGNTGIALAMVCAQRGYSLVCVMASSFSVERRKIMRALGAKVLLTPPALGSTGMTQKAEQLAEVNGWYLARQFETAANSEYHKKTTGPEIIAAFKRSKLQLDYWVTGYGTGGTFTGAGEAIKKASPKTKIVLSEPKGAPLVTSGKPQERKTVMGKHGAPASGHPEWKAHPIQGWTPNFIPLVCEDGVNKGLHDSITLVDPADAMATALDLAKKEGIFCGTSGGATVWAALEVCKTAPKGSNICAMVPDTAERYISTPLFASFEAEMNAEEQKLFDSTS